MELGSAHGPRKGHRKTRAGCLCCKARKVKCDEEKPACRNCINFDLPCHYTKMPPPNRSISHGTIASCENSAVASPRGRGRPRKNWAALHDAMFMSSADLNLELNSSRALHVDSEHTELNIVQAELLHQFVTSTGSSLAHTDQYNNSIVKFWTQNAPRIGLQTPAVLYLALSMSAYHLAYFYHDSSESRARYVSHARRYSTIGVRCLNRQLADINSSNCGALYTGAILIHFVLLAAGPSGPLNLLICDVEGESAGNWSSLAIGARLISSMFEPEVLYSGLMEPLSSASQCTENDTRPRCEHEDLPRIDWHCSLYKLGTFVASKIVEDEDTFVYIQAFENLVHIYEATFGDTNGQLTVHAGFKLPLSWLYLMDNTFVSLIRARDPRALLLLAYFAPLLKTLRRAWFQVVWGDHLLNTISEILGEESAGWLKWPMSIAKAMDNVSTSR